MPLGILEPRATPWLAMQLCESDPAGDLLMSIIMESIYAYNIISELTTIKHQAA